MRHTSQRLGSPLKRSFLPFVAVLLALPNSAFAHWEASYTYNGDRATTASGSTAHQPWTTSPSSLSGPVYGSSYMNSTTVGGSSIGTVTVKLTWVHDTPGDKPDAKILVVLHGTASWTADHASIVAWSGQSANGLGSPDAPIFDGARLTGSSSSGVRSYVKQSPDDYNRDGADPIEITNLPVISMSTQFSGSVPMANSAGGEVTCTLYAQVLAWHAHPTNWRVDESRTTNTPDGDLKIQYVWDSTSGATYSRTNPLAELNLCIIGEHIVYSGDGYNYVSGDFVYFQPFSPPFGRDWGPGLMNPTAPGGFQASEFQPSENARDKHTHSSIIQSYDRLHGFTATTFTGIQYYRFNCSLCMATNEFETLAGPFQITSTVEPISPFWQYRITKSPYQSILFLGLSN